MINLIFIALVIACIPAAIAQRKGRQFGLWYLYGLLLFPIALIHSLAASKSIEGLEQQVLETGKYRKCPSCAELVKLEANICKHCRSDLEPLPASVQLKAPTAKERIKDYLDIIGGLIVIIIIFALIAFLIGLLPMLKPV